MKNLLSIRQKVLGAMLLILALVATVGFLTYLEFSRVLDNAQNSGKPDPLINTAKNLVHSLTLTEVKVKTYSLTQDTLYLQQYDELRRQIELEVKNLEFQMLRTKIKNVPLDTLGGLIYEKMEILDSLLILQNEFRVQKALEKVSSTIDDAVEIVTITPEEKKWRPFSKKKKEENQPRTEINVDYDAIKSNVRTIRTLETNREEAQLQRELTLLEMDRQYNLAIQNIVTKLENAGLKLDRQRAQETKIIVRNANFQIAVFCILISIILLILGYTFLRYITQSNRYRRVLRRAKNEAESLSLAKEQFIATVSHEIRTPMNIISGFAEQLVQSKVTAQQKDQIQTIIKASSHLLKLVNEVLDFTKLENYKLNLEATNFRIRDVLNEIGDLMTPLAEAKGIEFDLLIHSKVPEVIVGDPIRLSQILINIASNAIKFTNEGLVSIEVGVTDIDEERVQFEFSVTDTGIGMSEDKIGRIFEAFEQAEASTTRNYGGTGLGLAITKKLIELHEGEVSVHSKENVGTEITVEISYPLGREDQLEETKMIITESLDLSAVHVLIADDETFNRKLLGTILKKYKASIYEAQTGLEAVEMASQSAFDIILMDARMPEMDGVSATREIRKQPNNQKTPIIALTAAVMPEDQKLYAEAGMNSFLPKPFKERDLLLKIAELLQLESSTTLNESWEQVENGSMNFGHLQSVSSGDSAFYLEMLQTFVSTTTEGLEKMQTKLKSKSWKQISDTAHKISAPCKHLEAESLYRILKEIEFVAQQDPNEEELSALIDRATTVGNEVLAEVQEEIQNKTNQEN